MKNIITFAAVSALMATTFVACDDEETVTTEETEQTEQTEEAQESEETGEEAQTAE